MIIFVVNKPFIDTKEYKNLLDCIYKMNLDVSQVCVYHKHDEELYYWVYMRKKRQRVISFVSVGKEVEKYLSLDRVDSFFKLPSLGKKAKDLDEQLVACKEWLNEQELLHNR